MVEILDCVSSNIKIRYFSHIEETLTKLDMTQGSLLGLTCGYKTIDREFVDLQRTCKIQLIYQNTHLSTMSQ